MILASGFGWESSFCVLGTERGGNLQKQFPKFRWTEPARRAVDCEGSRKSRGLRPRPCSGVHTIHRGETLRQLCHVACDGCGTK